MRAVLARAALAVVAILVIAWSAVLWRDDRIAQDAAKRLHENPNLGRAEWNHELDQLRRAELLNPATDWAMTRANYLILRDKRRAQEVAESVLRREPDNLDAWEVVHAATRGRDPQRAAEALREVRRLEPALER